MSLQTNGNGKVKSRLDQELNELAGATGKGLARIKKGDNQGSYLADIFIAQETKKWAEDRLKGAWKAAVDDGVVPEDDALREQAKGEHIITESSQFSCVVKVDTPRANFDKEAFITQVAKKFKIDAAKLTALAETCKGKGQPPLTKRVLEV
jgi:hypothetical protein